MSKLETKRKELELGRVEQARAELEFRIEEHLDQIEKFKKTIEVQLNREAELKQEIKQMKEAGE